MCKYLGGVCTGVGGSLVRLEAVAAARRQCVRGRMGHALLALAHPHRQHARALGALVLYLHMITTLIITTLIRKSPRIPLTASSNQQKRHPRKETPGTPTYLRPHLGFVVG